MKHPTSAPIKSLSSVPSAQKIKTDEFMNYVQLFRKWFADEELEVSDFVLGRMASRLQQYVADQPGSHQGGEDGKCECDCHQRDPFCCKHCQPSSPQDAKPKLTCPHGIMLGLGASRHNPEAGWCDKCFPELSDTPAKPAAEPKSYFDYSDETKQEILSKAAKASNEAQRQLLNAASPLESDSKGSGFATFKSGQAGETMEQRFDKKFAYTVKTVPTLSQEIKDFIKQELARQRQGIVKQVESIGGVIGGGVMLVSREWSDIKDHLDQGDK